MLPVSLEVMRRTQAMCDEMREKNSELEKKLSLERQSLSEARDDCATQANQLVKMKAKVAQAENQLQAAMYVFGLDLISIHST